MLLTLVSFCIGAFGVSLTRQLWAELATPSIILGSAIGWVAAVVLELVFLRILI